MKRERVVSCERREVGRKWTGKERFVGGGDMQKGGMKRERIVSCERREVGRT